MRLLRCGVAVTMVASLAACGSNGAEQDKATPTALASRSKACDILTQADAARALGRPVNKLDATGGVARLDICQYGYQGEKLLDTGHASVTLHDSPIAALKKGVVAEGYDAEEIGGIGDEAFWSHQSGLYVGKGGRTAIYVVGGGNIKDSKGPTVALAQATAGRI